MNQEALERLTKQIEAKHLERIMDGLSHEWYFWQSHGVEADHLNRFHSWMALVRSISEHGWSNPNG
jgi:hypothetical protein